MLDLLSSVCQPAGSRLAGTTRPFMSFSPSRMRLGCVLYWQVDLHPLKPSVCITAPPLKAAVLSSGGPPCQVRVKARMRRRKADPASRKYYEYPPLHYLFTNYRSGRERERAAVPCQSKDHWSEQRSFSAWCEFVWYGVSAVFGCRTVYAGDFWPVSYDLINKNVHRIKRDGLKVYQRLQALALASRGDGGYNVIMSEFKLARPS